MIPTRSVIASMLVSDPDKSWFRIAKASVIMAARSALNSALLPFSMRRRFPLPVRRSLASIDRTTGSRSAHWLAPPASRAAPIFARLNRISIRSAATAARSTSSRTRLLFSSGGATNHRSESLNAFCRAASSVCASRSSGASAPENLGPGREKRSQPVEYQPLDVARWDAHSFPGLQAIPSQK